MKSDVKTLYGMSVSSKKRFSLLVMGTYSYLSLSDEISVQQCLCVDITDSCPAKTAFKRRGGVYR